MARQNRFTRKASGPKKAFQLSVDAPLVQFYGGGTKARVRVPESPHMPMYDVDSDEFVAAVQTLADAGYRAALARVDSTHAAAVEAALAGRRYTPPAPEPATPKLRARPTNPAPTRPRPHPVSRRKLRRRRRRRPAATAGVKHGIQRTEQVATSRSNPKPAVAEPRKRRHSRSERKAAAKAAKRRARAEGSDTTPPWRRNRLRGES